MKTKYDSQEYETRRNEMLDMRFQQGKTNTEIGVTFGISRERVRQIIGNTGKDFRSRWTLSKINTVNLSSMIRDQLYKLPGVISVWENAFSEVRHRVKKGGYVANGQKWENKASQILSDSGIENKLMKYHDPFDIITENGVRIDVKHAGKYNPPSYRSVNNYRASNTKKGRSCDFFFVFLNEDVYFVIPSSEVVGDYIIIPYPANKKPSKWHKYYKRLDLLTEAK